MKQTAVKWLEDCLIEKHPNGSFVWNTRADLEALFKQAKEMEKQQQGYSEEDIKKAFQVGFNVGYYDNESPSYLTFEEWFNKYKIGKKQI